MDLGLRDARVLVTAASQGLGAATARQFAAEGARVVISSRSEDKLRERATIIREATGQMVHTYAADVTDHEATRQLVAQTVQILGGLDILVTNAGGPPAGRFDDFDGQTWHEAVELTLLSAVQVIREAAPHLRQSERAAILAITSITAREPKDNLTLSNVLRPAVVGLTKTLAREFAADGIRVNSILPGMTHTHRITQLMQARAARHGTTEADELEQAGRNIPLGRIGQPDEFANAAVFLCSPAASFITGVALSVDGGEHHAIL